MVILLKGRHLFLMLYEFVNNYNRDMALHTFIYFVIKSLKLGKMRTKSFFFHNIFRQKKRFF